MSATASFTLSRRDSPSRRRRQGGFSLLEVLVAFAILALTLGILIQVFSRALTTTVLSANYSRAATLAEARLNAVGVDFPLEVGEHTGEPEDDLDWRLVIEPYELGDVTWEPTLTPYLVTAVVSWDEAAGRRQLALSTLRLGAADDFGTSLGP